MPVVEPTGFYPKLKKWLRDTARVVKETLYEPLYWLGISVRLTSDEELAIQLYGSLRYQFVEQTDIIRLSFWSADPQFSAFGFRAP